MAHFVTTHDGRMLNLSRVAEFCRNKESRSLTAYDSKGQDLGDVYQSEIEESLGFVVPNTSDTVLLVAWHDPEQHDPRIERYPIIAWRISPAGTQPVTCDFLDDQEFYLELRDGGKPYAWLIPADCLFDDYELFVSEIGKRAKARHDEFRAVNQPTKEPPETARNLP